MTEKVNKRTNWRNILIYTVHITLVLATGWILSLSGLANIGFLAIIACPLLLALFPKNEKWRIANWSYTVNVRLLFPISTGIFFLALYNYFPTLISGTGMVSESNPIGSAIQNSSRFGIPPEASPSGTIYQNFFEINDLFKDAVTVLYAICVAFLLLKGLSDYDELKQVLYAEANEVRKISDFATYFTESGDPETNHEPVFELRQTLCEYLRNMQEGNEVVVSEANEGLLEHCLRLVGQLKPDDLNDRIALEQIMHSVSQLSTLRANRTVCIEKRMSPFILGLVFLMSVTIVLSFFGRVSEEVTIDYIYIFLLPAFYTSIFMTLLDLSSPFDGYWQIKLDAIRNVSAKISWQLEKMTIGRKAGSIEEALALHREEPT